jgi:hypothetical protein
MLSRSFVSTLILVSIVFASVSLLPRPVARAADLKVCGTSDVQFLGYSDVLNKASFGGFPLTELSGIAYEPERGVYYVVADRLGTTPAHVFTLTVPISNDAMGVPLVTDVARLADKDGAWFTGINLDGEGIALNSASDVFVSSEGGTVAGAQPAVYHFSLAGGYLGALTVPQRFLIGTNNLSFEGLTMSPSKRSLFIAMEGPLPADGQTGDFKSRIRIIRYDNRGVDGYVAAEQYYYLTEAGRTPGDLGVAEILALSDTELLVLERGFAVGEGNTVRVYSASLKGASNVASVAALATTTVAPLQKALLFDLASCPESGAKLAPGATQPNALLDNFEAMTLGPALSGGRRAFVMVSDDNSGANQTARVVALAVNESKLQAR